MDEIAGGTTLVQNCSKLPEKKVFRPIAAQGILSEKHFNKIYQVLNFLA